MGVDFIALMRDRRTGDVLQAIHGLEQQTDRLTPEDQALWRASGFAPSRWRRACWVAYDDRRQVKRPDGPDLSLALAYDRRLVLTFGQGVLRR